MNHRSFFQMLLRIPKERNFIMKIVRGCCLSLLILGIFCPSAYAANEITITAPDERELFSWDDAITLK